jgi:hypothetical protein
VIRLAFHARLTGGCVTPRNLPDDIALVTISISDATLCADCIAKKTGIPLARVEPLLIRIASTLRILSAAALCDACLTAKRVFRLA